MTLIAPDPAATEDPEAEKRKQHNRLLLAAIFWNTVHPQYAGMLTGNNGWTWDQYDQAYESRNGSKLRQDTLRFLALSLVDATEHKIEDVTAKMTRGDLAVDAWNERVADILIDENYALVLLGSGGVDNVQTEDLEDAWGTVGTPAKPEAGLTESLVRLKNFADELKKNEWDGERATVQRAGSYARTAYAVYEEVRGNSFGRATDENGKLLWLFEQSVLDPAVINHCTNKEFTEGCVEIAEAGWQALGSLPKPGQRSCFSNCHCFMRYATIPPDGFMTIGDTKSP